MGSHMHKIKAKAAEGAFDYQQKIVPPLAYLLMQSSMEDLFGFLQKMHMQWTVTVDAKGKYICRIFKWKITEEGSDREQEFGFVGINDKSPKAAVCNALSRFLAYCKDDFHEFISSDWPDLLAAKETSRRHARAAAAIKNHPDMVKDSEPC